MENLKALLVQPDTVWEDPGANRRRIEIMMQKTGEKFDLVVLPETFSTGYSMDPERLAEEMAGETVAWMKGLARDMGAHVVGSLLVREMGHFYNRLIAAGPDGDLQYYDKGHPFPLSGEGRVVARGTERKIFEIKGWKIAPFICYDLRFPCWSRNNGEGYDCILYVACWPVSRASHWNALLKARAIENQSYCIGVNRTGADGNGITCGGGSQALDFDGQVIASLGEEEGIITVTLSRNALVKYREQFPWLKNADEPVV